MRKGDLHRADRLLPPVAQPAPVLDAAYLEERARLYAAAAEDLPPELRPGSSLPLRPPAAAASLDDAAAAAASSALARLLVAQPPAPTQMALARQVSGPIPTLRRAPPSSLLPRAATDCGGGVASGSRHQRDGQA